MNLRDTVARVALPTLGLPKAPRQSPGRSGWPTTFRNPAEGPTPTPRPLVPYLYWLQETQPIVFHGSQHRALVELTDERKSRDTTAYGDQTAVFASQDPIWAIFFAVLRRDAIRSTYNASLGADAGVRGRRYFLSVDGDSVLFAPGALYVLPDSGFAHQPRFRAFRHGTSHSGRNRAPARVVRRRAGRLPAGRSHCQARRWTFGRSRALERRVGTSALARSLRLIINHFSGFSVHSTSISSLEEIESNT